MDRTTVIGRVRICFAPPDAKLSGVFALLLEQHGMTSVPVCCDAADTAGEDASATLVALSTEAKTDEVFRRRCRDLRDQRGPLYVVRFDDAIATDLPDGLERAPVYEFTADGLRALLEELDGRPSKLAALEPLVSASDAERRDWNLQRFRYGLWLAFSRATGSGKFDPFPLTHSKRIGTAEALMPEAIRYGYRDPESGGPVAPQQALGDALDRVWNDPENMVPNAIHVVEATAEQLWNRYRPSSPGRLLSA